MNKVFKVIAIVGNVSEVLIATSMVADLISKLRGKSTKSTINMEVDEIPQSETPIAAWRN